VDVVGFALGGLVAGEGSFVIARGRQTFADGSPRRRFRFELTMAERDRPMVEALRSFLGVGSIRDMPPSREGWLPGVRLTINSHRAHRKVTIPFAEQFLLPCAKRRQFDEWRAELDRYESEHPTRYGQGPSPCSVPECGRPVRGRGLCRRHYYRATGY
jgi:hypothetical protein